MREQLPHCRHADRAPSEFLKDAIDPVIQRRLSTLDQKYPSRRSRQHFGQRGQVVARVDGHGAPRVLRRAAPDGAFKDAACRRSTDGKHGTGKCAIVDGPLQCRLDGI